MSAADTIDVAALVAFANEAATYFEKRPTGGEDMAHWSNVYNAENCRQIATTLQSQADALAEARRALTAIDRIIGGSIKDNGEEKFTLNIKGEKYEGPAVEFVGYALTSIQGIARAALAKEGK